jgi:hypothetical protein
MAATKTRSTGSANGNAASRTAATVKDAGSSVAGAARKAKGPALAAGTAAAGLAGGLAIGARMNSKRGAAGLFAPRRKVLGVPVARKNGPRKTAETLGQVARELSSATSRVSSTAEDVREIREQLDKLNRRSPLEVVVDALTHRRGAHKRES